MADHELGPARIIITARRDEADKRKVLAIAAGWYERHRRPATQQEWDAMPGVPMSARTVRRRWGWRAIWQLALKDRELRAGQPGLGWSDAEMVYALVEAYRRDSAWPTLTRWARAETDHPSSRTYTKRFGSWRMAVEIAERMLRIPATPRGGPLGARDGGAEAADPGHR
jgi:hypothetical protein